MKFAKISRYTVGYKNGISYMYYCVLSLEPCQDENDIKCNFNSAFDTNITQCVSTTLNCVKNFCTAVINTVKRGLCQFMNIGANVSLPIHCCVCGNRDHIISPISLSWDCNITTPSSILLVLGEYLGECSERQNSAMSQHYQN